MLLQNVAFDHVLVHLQRDEISPDVIRLDLSPIEPLVDKAKTCRDYEVWDSFNEYSICAPFNYRHYNPRIDHSSNSRGWKLYNEFNQAVAQCASQLLAANYQEIFILQLQDHRLLLLPDILRSHNPDIRIQFNLPIPFPGPESLRRLSYRKELLHGLLGSDSIGFSSVEYLENFTSCAIELLHLRGSSEHLIYSCRTVALQVVRARFSVQRLRQAAFDDSEVSHSMREVEALLRGRRLLLCLDRPYWISAVLAKLKVFEHILETDPRRREDLFMLIVLKPTKASQRIDDIQKIQVEELKKAIFNLNVRFGSILQPVTLCLRDLKPASMYYALLRSSDVGLITSFEEHLEPFIGEYILCQEGKKGSFVLSELQGEMVSQRQHGIYYVPAWNVHEMIEAVKDCLTLCDVKRSLAYQEARSFADRELASEVHM